jgi:hypothetical protein
VPDGPRDAWRRVWHRSGSDPGDWNVIAQPPLLQQMLLVSEAAPPGGVRQHVSVEHPSYSMAMRSDLGITMVAGIVCAATFADPWASAFGDAHTEYLVFCFNGAPVYRTLYVAVDAEHCWLPLPRAGTSAVPKPYAQLLRLLNGLTREIGYDEYFARAGLSVVDEPWPD